MTKKVSRYKADRRYGVNIWGHSKSPVNSRNYKPGEHHSKSVPLKASGYGAQLAEKQKIKHYYGDLGNKQLRNYYKSAGNSKGDVGANLVGLLERRLATVVYRLKLSPTIFSARQLISHGHVSVNNKRVTISSYLVSRGDVIQLSDKAKNFAFVVGSLESKDMNVPSYLSLEDSKNGKGQFLRTPAIDEVPFPFVVNVRYIVEWFNRTV